MPIRFGVPFAVAIGAAVLAGCGTAGQPQISCDDPAATCASLGTDFGSVSAECGEVSCGRLRFERKLVGSTVIPDGTDVSMIATSQGLVLAYSINDEVRVARELPDGTYAPELVAQDPYGDEPPSLAATPDGRIWLAYYAQQGLKLAVSVPGGLPDGSRYALSQGPGAEGKSPSLAVDANGVAHLGFRTYAYSQETQSVSIVNVQHAAVTDGVWSVNTVETVDLNPQAGVRITRPSVLLDASGAAHLFYLVSGGTGLLRHATRGDSGYLIEELGPTGEIYNEGQLSTALDGSGRLHVLYPEAPFNLRHAFSSDAGWEFSLVASSHANRENALAIDTSGKIHIAFHSATSIRYGVHANGYWPSQEVLPCENGKVSLAIDKDGNPRIAQRCGGLSVLEIAGHFAADFDSTCDRVVTSICADACRCSSSATATACGISYSTGQSSTSSESACGLNLEARICGDATLDPAPLYTCNDALAPFACVDPSQPSRVQLIGTACDIIPSRY